MLGALLTKRPDVVVGTSPQFFCAVSAYLLSCVKRVPFVFEVRDIWPQSAVELGALCNRVVIRALEAIELFLYRRAALIVGVAESTREYLMDRGIPLQKLAIIPNGIDSEYLSEECGSPEECRRSLGWEGKFIVSYVGTHGMSHALDTVVHSAAALRDEPDIHFLFVGEGAEKANLKELAARLQLNNVTFVDQQPRDALLSFYRASHVGLVPLKRLPIFQKVLPSKMFEWMGVGCPIICSVEGEAARLIERAGAGLCVESESVPGLVEAIKRLRGEIALRRQLAKQGEEFVKARYLRSVMAEKYLVALGSLIKRDLATADAVLVEKEAHHFD